ncbi:hypothetical protein MRB53_021598 [Persea americana]|uniref:Uncharacterized protein n=1 Tax=Persea americana TaxID=3435 RepID=A0ACC2L4F1_PERAE|nr:hypothetical protein MRB53_021598 [Persea americana]
MRAGKVEEGWNNGGRHGELKRWKDSATTFGSEDIPLGLRRGRRFSTKLISPTNPPSSGLSAMIPLCKSVLLGLPRGQLVKLICYLLKRSLREDGRTPNSYSKTLCKARTLSFTKG